MTNSFLSFALKAFGALALVVLTGCGSSDGSKEYADGKAAYEARNLKEAETLLERSLSIASTNVDAWVHLALTRIGLAKIPEAKDAVRRAAELGGGDLDVRMLSAHVAWYEKDYETANRIFTEIAENAAATPQMKSRALVGRGIVEMDGKHRSAARTSLLLALREDGKNASAWYHLAMLYRSQYQFTDAALDSFESFAILADKIDERVKRVRQVLIPELREQRRREFANRPGADKRDSKACSRAILDAQGAIKNKQLTKARKFFERAVVADPLSYPAVMGLARTISRLDTSVKGRQLALKYYLTACELQSSSSSTLLTAGELAMATGAFATASSCYSRALAINHRNITAIDGLIRALRKCGRRDEAQIYQAYRERIAPIVKR